MNYERNRDVQSSNHEIIYLSFPPFSAKQLKIKSKPRSEYPVSRLRFELVPPEHKTEGTLLQPNSLGLTHS
jgi:hypothetical protein